LITAEEARTHPERHVILQALGQRNAISPAIQHFPFKFGDRLLLCSDGLSSYVSHKEIEDILNKEADEHACCQRLLEAAYAAGGGDNITILLARLLMTPSEAT
jgi:protein phosphatase